MTMTQMSSRVRTRIVHGGILATVIAVALAAQLMLSIGLADGGYQINQLQQDQNQVKRERQSLSEQISALQSPQYLSERAKDLGMEPSTQVTFLRLADGQTIGSADSRGAQIASQKGLVNNRMLATLNTSDATSKSSQSDQTKVPQQVSQQELQAGATADASTSNSSSNTAGDTTSTDSAQNDGSRLPQVTLR
ncbi:septum formation initiator family protein [Pseudoclavibacter sp. 13-3]|uniref:septum formation initiator family protein n=1 Tax=Pseudoclavibacter sp. 13-3 TaxID=2901228 RepID=UPI001E2A92AF|nr:septum formation initiator family protein [Pseudoclavibacter sp. 13-3]MCD7102055.1 septum formation initiator family protein [Pseudoclavibacter sp. 13-3]